MDKLGTKNGGTAEVASQRGRSPEALAVRLRAAGQRVTPQRLMILGAFAQPGEHLTAEEVYDRVGPLAPAVNRSTVYRTLELFRDLGLISETDLGGGVRHFELLDDGRHHHLICRECGEMLVLDDDLVQPLREGIRERYGFSATVDHLALFGLCDYCHRQSAEGRAQPAES
ncbi:MAG: transcriptional repressor [Actinomycetota bacterium]|nr:transcriptional repressor [Actinomycetota bacterium]